MVFKEEFMKGLFALSHKGFQGIVATVERANIGLRTIDLRETYKSNPCYQKMNQGASQLKAPHQTVAVIFLWSESWQETQN